MCREACLFTALSLHFCQVYQKMEKHHPLPQSLLECGNCSGLRKKDSLFLKPVAIPSKRASCPKWSSPLSWRPSGSAAAAAAAAGRFWGPSQHRLGVGSVPRLCSLVAPACPQRSAAAAASRTRLRNHC